MLLPASSLMNDSPMWPGVERLQAACLGMVLLDMETIFPVEEHLFTRREAARAARMGLRRRKGFTAARVALKRLARQLNLVEKDRSDRMIETLGPDDVRPCLDESGIYCSVSHCGRVVIAVAHRHPIGVDLEMVSEKVIRTKHLFMSPRERDLISPSGLGPQRAATRAWTTKEAAAKVLGLHLFQALREVEVVRLSEKDGMMQYQEKTYPVRHSEGNGYVITLITCDDL
ncbi:MAG TPA: 4'-phosphopantetheinyl transferase superfamily protein [Thermodesulfobacteriota bacterium]|nr:4'-phosphopantetheinyl transferase superfamily protein [Thermodesulfobacteriota bacterium]